MKFHIITIFPEIFESYFNASIVKRALEKRKIQIQTYGIRMYAKDKHKTVDNTPYGGGAGMVLIAEPILKTVASITRKKNKKRKIIIFSPKGKQFTQTYANILAKKYDELIFITGRYEGIDERVKTILKAEELSIGPYVLTDGDVAAMVVVSAVTRLIPGVIKEASLSEESHTGNLGEYPQYTKPETIIWKGKKYRVPKVLLSGNHKKIAEWRSEKSR